MDGSFVGGLLWVICFDTMLWFGLNLLFEFGWFASRWLLVVFCFVFSIVCVF